MAAGGGEKEELEEPAFVTVARVLKARGRVGEVLCELHTDFPERFAERRRLYAWDGGPQRRELRLEAYWPHRGGMVLKFQGVDSIEEAERLRGCEIQIPLAERAELEEGACYVSDLIGCAVIEMGGVGRGEANKPNEAKEIGRVADVDFGAGTAPLLVVKSDAGREFLIPFVESFLERMDLAGKRIEMRLPEGLLEVDAPLGPDKKLGPGEEKRPSARRKR